MLSLASVAGAAFAVNTVTQEITAGVRSASVADVTLTAVTYSHEVQSNTGTLTLTADDSTGSDLGWNVTIESSDFTSGGNTIPAENFSITQANAPTLNVGQTVDPTNGPMVPTASPAGTLDTARKVIQANAGYGKGNYSQTIDVELSIPGQQLAGTYAATLTTTIAAAP